MSPISTFSLLSLLLFSITCSSVFAADINSGQQKAVACVGCHGQDGNSKSPQWPNLAGQQPAYLANQLKAFRAGKRINQTMQEMAANLTDDEINSLAAYYANLSPKSAGGDQQIAKAGKEKFSMCSGCHGVNAEGRDMFPRLAGQHPEYITKQLNSFKDGSRTGGPMPSMAASLSVDDIKAIAAYLGTLK